MDQTTIAFSTSEFEPHSFYPALRSVREEGNSFVVQLLRTSDELGQTTLVDI